MHTNNNFKYDNFFLKKLKLKLDIILYFIFISLNKIKSQIYSFVFLFILILFNYLNFILFTAKKFRLNFINIKFKLTYIIFCKF